MNIEKFKLTELRYNELKEKHNAGEISADEMKKQLKSLMILDDNGRYWMIGGKTGKWYTYNGKEWAENNPYPEEQEELLVEEHIDTSDNPFPSRNEYSFYSDKDEPAFEQHKEDDAEESAHISLDDTEQATTISFSSDSDDSETASNTETESIKTTYTEHYAAKQVESTPYSKTLTSLTKPTTPVVTGETKNDTTISLNTQPPSPSKPIKEVSNKESSVTKMQPTLSQDLGRIAYPTQFTIKQISLLPSMIFMGGFGSIFGVIFGAMFGIFKLLEPLAAIFPLMLVEMRGKVFGGLLFAAIGGLAGFILFALTGALIALFYNTVASVFCGMRFKIKAE